jgi:tRNA-intron endonuclease
MPGSVGFFNNSRFEYVMDRPVLGHLIENRIVIWNIEESRTLFRNGYYGKPVGISKPKGSDFEVPIVLDLIEGCYLVERGELSIRSKLGKTISVRRIKTLCRKQYDNFDAKYLVFKVLKEKGYVIAPGIKFGCDFAVYEQGPGIDHAPFLISVYVQATSINATSIVLSGRLATTVRKQFILACPRLKKGRVYFIGIDWWRA